MTDNGLAAYLKSELQLLSTEARKKHPEIKEASERVIVILRTQKNLPNTGQNEVARELAKSEDALRPLFMACETKQPKLVAVAMRCLQRLSQHSAIASASIRVVFKALDSVADIDMDTQIKILQILLPIVRNYESIRGGVLAEAFLLCFKLLAVDNSVISNTAKATLRQLIDVVFERAATANPNRDREPENGAAPALDDGCDIKSDGKESTTKLGSTPLDPLVKDAYFILQDLALLIRGEEPVFIWIKHLDKAFVYELIETILSNHARVFTQHGELRMLVCEKLTPLFILFLESTTDEPPFQHIVMQFRLILCFIRNWATDIPAETEFFVSLIVRLAESMPDSDGGSSILGLEGGRIFGNDGLGAAGRKTVVARSLDAYSFSSGGQEASSIIIPSYIRVLALEVVQQVCATGGLLKALYSQFDYAEDGCKVVQSIVVALGKVTTERPELCSPAINDQPQERSNDTMAAAATMSEDKDAKDDRAPVDQRSLITRNSLTPRISVLQLYDRAVLPTLPEHYLFYLAFASTLEIVKAMVGDMFDSLPVIQGPRSGSRILASFISDAEDDEKASLARHWATENWPITLATFSFFMNVDLEPALFQQMLRSLETMVKAVGAFDMMLARDSYISMLYRNCLPNSTIAQYDRQQRQRHSVGGGGRQLATLSSPEIPFTMGYRHLQSLMTLLNCAEFLANSLDSLWYPIVVTYQQAEEVLYRNHGNAVAPGDDKPTTNYTAATAAVGAAATVSPGGSDGNINDKPFFGRAQFNSSLPKDAASLISRFDCLLLSVKDFNCRGFMWFVGALCTLDVDISGMPVRRKHRKFVQSMHQRASFPVLLPTALTRLVFPIRVLREVALDNMDRLLNISPETHENGSASRLAEFAGLTSLGLVMHHLLDTATYINAVEPLKTQACEVAAAVMLGTMEYVVRLSAETDSATQAKDSDEIQLRILTPLAQMMVTSERYRSESFDESEHRLFSPSVEVKALALDTLNRLLQTSGHSIVSAWEVVFEILKSVVDEAMVKYGQYPASHSRDNTLGENAINVTASAGARDNAGHDDGHVQAEAGTVAKSMATATTLVRAAFACLQLVCSDFLSALPAPSLRQCIDSIGRYGRQRGDLNLALTSVGLAWDMSNHLRGLIQSADQEGQTAEADDGLSKDGLVIEELWLAGLENTATPNARTVRILWLLLLDSISRLCTDQRSEVRNGAVQTLFRVLDMHGELFGAKAWDFMIETLLYPMVDSMLECRIAVVCNRMSASRNKAAEPSNGEGLVEGEQNRDGSEMERESRPSHIMSRSGVWVEDPHELELKQWDKTVIMVLQGVTSGLWTKDMTAAIENMADPIPAWEKLWSWIHLTSVGEVPRVKLEEAGVDSSQVSLMEFARIKRRMLSKSIITTCVQLIGSLVQACKLLPLPSSQADISMGIWRVSWSAWLRIGFSMTSFMQPITTSLLDGGQQASKNEAPVTINAREVGDPIYTQELLTSLANLFVDFLSIWESARALTKDDILDSLRLFRSLVLYFDAPTYQSDISELTPLQMSIMSSLGRLESLCYRDLSSSLSTVDTTKLLIEEYAKYATLPYVLFSSTVKGTRHDKKYSPPNSALMDDELQRTRRAYGDQCLERCRTIATSATWAKQMTHYNKSPVRPTLIAQAKLAMQRMVQVFSQHLSPQNATSVDKGIIGALLGENVTIVIVSSLGVALAHHYNDRPVPHIQAPGDVAAALSSVWYIAANSLLELVPSVLVAMAEYHRSLPLDLVRSTWRSLVAILEIAFAKPPSGGGSRSGTITQYQVRLLNVVLSESLKFINRIIGTTRGQVDASDVGGQEAVSRDDGQLLTIDDFNADWERIVSLLDQGVAMPSIFGIPYSVSITTARPVPDLSVELVSLVWMFALTGDFMPDSELDSLLDDGDQRHRDYLAEFEQYQSVIVDGGETASRKSRFPAVPVEISRIVAPVLMQRSALIISHCICSYRTLGGCPPPRYYTSIVVLTLYYLAKLRFRPGVIAAPASKTSSSASSESDPRMVSPTGKISWASDSSASHIVLLYRQLCDLITCQDPLVVRMTQACLRRLTPDLCGNLDIPLEYS